MFVDLIPWGLYICIFYKKEILETRFLLELKNEMDMRASKKDIIDEYTYSSKLTFYHAVSPLYLFVVLLLAFTAFNKLCIKCLLIKCHLGHIYLSWSGRRALITCFMNV